MPSDEGQTAGGSAALAEVLLDLLRRSHDLHPGQVGALADESARRLGAEGATLHLIGLQQRALVPIDALGEAAGTPQPVDGTVPGRAYLHSQRQITHNESVHLWVPLIDGVDRLGLLEVRFATEPPDDLQWPEDLASMLVLLLVVKGAYTDAYTRSARTEETTVAAEMVWSLLPPLTLRTPEVAVAGILEPAYEVGGDTFDYALAPDHLRVAMFDAMGHGMPAALSSALSVATLRHARRRGDGLLATAAELDEVIMAEYGGERFVTAVLMEMALHTGELRWVNTGHPAPLLLREGRVRGTIPCVAVPPLGTGLDPGPPPVNEFSLQPGDRVLLYSDGVTEGRRPGHEPFGEERLAEELDKAALAGLGTAETMRRTARAVLDHHEHELRDDFTMVLVEFRQPLAG